MTNGDEPVGADSPAPEIDSREIEQMLSSSKAALSAAVPRFRLVRELGRRCEPPLADPAALAVDASDRILVLDRLASDAFRVVRFAADGAAGEETARIPCAARDGLRSPTGMCVGPGGELYFTDGELNAVVRFSSDGRWLDSIRSDGPDGRHFRSPRDVEVDDSGRLCVVDSFNDRVVLLSADGRLEQEWSEFSNPLTEEDDDGLYEPSSVCVGADGTVFIADANEHRVVAFRDGRLVAQWGGPSLFEFPSEVRLARDGRRLYVADQGNLRVRRFDVAPGRHDKSACKGVLSLDGAGNADVAGGLDIDVLSSGHVALINPRRQSVVILDFPEA